MPDTTEVPDVDAFHPVGEAKHVGLLDYIERRLPTLTKSEQKVAVAVLADPARIIRDGVADLARRAEVSEPTVMRFAAALGFSGYQDFKISLAQSVALGIPQTQSSIQETDGVAETVEKIFDYSVTNLAQAHRRLDLAAVERAAERLRVASHIVFLGLGASSVVAQDAQQKFPLFGIPCSAPVDQHMQYLTAATAAPGTCVVAISNTGRTAVVVDAVTTARGLGAFTIGITGERSPLSAAAECPIIVETSENTDYYTPTTSRLAHLVVIDVLATLVAMKQPDPYKDQLREAKARLAIAKTVGYGDVRP